LCPLNKVKMESNQTSSEKVLDSHIKVLAILLNHINVSHLQVI
jgi:hypothetical protein